jgi:hypothetical protein
MTPARSVSKDPLDRRQRSSLDAHSVPVLAVRLYTRFGAICGRPYRRTAVSLGIGGVCFLVGLALSSAIGFSGAYIASPGVYLLIFSGVFTLDRLQWGACAFIEQLNASRGAFLTTDDDYEITMRALLRRMSASAPVVVLLLPLIAIVVALLVVSTLAADQPVAAIARWLGILPIPSLPAAWFTPPYLAVKLVTLEWLLAVTLFGVVALLSFSAHGVVGWARLIQRWPVIPIPSAVQLRFGGFGGFAVRALAHTSIAVLAAVLFYGGEPTPFLIALVVIFAVTGLLCGLIPLVRVNGLVRRSQAQIADAVSEQYLATLYPIASGPDPIASGPALPERPHDVDAAHVSVDQGAADSYRALSVLEDLMARSNDAGGGRVGLTALLATVVSQLIPLLGFLYPLIGKR